MENDLKAKRQQQAQYSERLGREVCLVAGSCMLAERARICVGLD